MQHHIVNKMIADRIQYYTKKIVGHDQAQFVPKGWLNHWKSISVTLHKLKNKIHIIISIDSEKIFDKIEHSPMVKTLRKLEIEENFLDLIKTIHHSPPPLKPIDDIALNGERLNAFPLRSGTGAEPAAECQLYKMNQQRRRWVVRRALRGECTQYHCSVHQKRLRWKTLCAFNHNKNMENKSHIIQLAKSSQARVSNWSGSRK